MMIGSIEPCFIDESNMAQFITWADQVKDFCEWFDVDKFQAQSGLGTQS